MTIDDETLPAFIPLPVREFTWLPCWHCGKHMGGCGCEIVAFEEARAKLLAAGPEAR